MWAMPGAQYRSGAIRRVFEALEESGLIVRQTLTLQVTAQPADAPGGGAAERGREAVLPGAGLAGGGKRLGAPDPLA